MNPQQPNDSELDEKVRNLIYDGDYACTRVWEAWQVGTMTEDDFVPLDETERVDEIVQLIQDEILKARVDAIQLYMDTCEREGVPPSWRNLRAFQDGQEKALAELNQPNTNKEMK